MKNRSVIKLAAAGLLLNLAAALVSIATFGAAIAVLIAVVVWTLRALGVL